MLLPQVSTGGGVVDLRKASGKRSASTPVMAHNSKHSHFAFKMPYPHLSLFSDAPYPLPMILDIVKQGTESNI